MSVDHLKTYIIIMGYHNQVPFGESIFGLNSLEAFNSERKSVLPLKKDEITVEIAVIDRLDFH